MFASLLGPHSVLGSRHVEGDAAFAARRPGIVTEALAAITNSKFGSATPCGKAKRLMFRPSITDAIHTAARPIRVRSTSPTPRPSHGASGSPVLR